MPPAIGKFFGIHDAMYVRGERNPPRFSAFCAEHEAQIDIQTLEAIERPGSSWRHVFLHQLLDESCLMVGDASYLLRPHGIHEAHKVIER